MDFLDEGLVLERVRPGSKFESATETTATRLRVGYVGQDNEEGNDNDGLLMGDVEHREMETAGRLVPSSVTSLFTVSDAFTSSGEGSISQELCYNNMSMSLMSLR